ncbi:hypothetical protein TGAM01_v207964, partial [Trichoderma gamsii]
PAPPKKYFLIFNIGEQTPFSPINRTNTTRKLDVVPGEKHKIQAISHSDKLFSATMRSFLISSPHILPVRVAANNKFANRHSCKGTVQVQSPGCSRASSCALRFARRRILTQGETEL